MMVPVSYHAFAAGALSDVLNRYRGMPYTRVVTDFETRISTLSGVPHVVATNTGTAALHLALEVMGIGRGDRVLVPTFAYVAVVNPVLYLGAEPVFVDCEKDTWNLDLNLVESALATCRAEGRPIKAIVAVHNFGTPTDMERLMRLAVDWKVAVVEDAAESFGGMIEGKWVGGWGHIGTFSFNSNKTVTAFGGGAVVTQNGRWADHARYLAAQAREPRPYYEFARIGYNYLMSPLNAAYGLTQLDDVKRLNEKRRKLFAIYKDTLSGRAEGQQEPPGFYSTRWLSTFLFHDKRDLTKISNTLQRQNFELRRLWNPLHLQQHLMAFKAFDSGVASDFFERGVCLPTSLEDEKAIAEQIQSIRVTLGLK